MIGAARSPVSSLDVARPPWECTERAAPSKDPTAGADLHHRGWTLVEVDGWLWAVSDANCNVRRRVCRRGGTHGHRERVARFRAAVDEIEDAR